LRAEEDPWDREDGTIWLRWEIRPWQSLDGVPGGILIFSEDITHRKNAQEALLGMSRKLIEAHEQERTRIGRDLHDDFVQRLVMLPLELGGVQQDVPDSASEVRARIGTLQDETTRLTNDVQLLSHELHSSKLEYLGIVGATKNFCKEFSERHKVEIDFQSHDLPTALPTEVSLSLFRVLQEALRNATKHSGVKRFEVRLWGSMGEIHLTISDLGAGFDTETAMKGTGLGLTSMQERLRLVGGKLSINSQPKGGTTIQARIPSIQAAIPSALPGNNSRLGDLVSCLRSWRENLIWVETRGSLPFCKLGRNVTRQASTDKTPALINCLHGS
jgi:signal transduction histidine kinase